MSGGTLSPYTQLMVSTMSRKKSQFDTRPKTSVSASESSALEYYTDQYGNVHVRQHSRDGGLVQVQQHARRKGLRDRLKPKLRSEPKEDLSPSESYLKDLDKRSKKFDKSFKERAENI